MKVYKANNEIVSQIKDGEFYAGESIDTTAFALDINASIRVSGDINAGDIKVWNINAGDINYYAVAYAYQNITCRSITSTRAQARHFVLDGTLEIKGEG